MYKMVVPIYVGWVIRRPQSKVYKNNKICKKKDVQKPPFPLGTQSLYLDNLFVELSSMAINLTLTQTTIFEYPTFLHKKQRVTWFPKNSKHGK